MSICTLCERPLIQEASSATPCKHVFHARCILSKIGNIGLCPKCKYILLPSKLVACSADYPEAETAPPNAYRAHLAKAASGQVVEKPEEETPPDSSLPQLPAALQGGQKKNFQTVPEVLETFDTGVYGEEY